MSADTVGPYKTLIGLKEKLDTPILCAICKCNGKLHVCETNSDGFVCGSEECKYMIRMLGGVMGMDVLRIEPIKFNIKIIRNMETGALMINNMGKELPTPEELAFSCLEQHNLLVRPDHEQVIEMCFHDLTHTHNKDAAIDTIYIKISKPLQYIVATDGSTNTYCQKWQFTCLPGGNASMCEAIPVHAEGPCMIKMRFSDMERCV